MRGSKATAQLTVVNHPITGPVLYSPHQTPFICETQASGLGAPLDADCSATTKVEYFYRSTAAPSARRREPGRPRRGRQRERLRRRTRRRR